MDLEIFKNSYIAATFTFIVSYLLMYIFVIGFEKNVVNGKVIKKPSWKLPLIFALLVWTLWYFYLFPTRKDLLIKQNSDFPEPGSVQISQKRGLNGGCNGYGYPKLIAEMWI